MDGISCLRSTFLHTQYSGPGFRTDGGGEGEITKAQAEAERALEHSSALGDRIKNLVSIHPVPSLALKTHWRKVGPEKCVFLGKQEEESLGVYHIEISTP